MMLFCCIENLRRSEKMIIESDRIIFDNLISASSPDSDGEEISINVKPFQGKNSKGEFCQFDNIKDLHDSAKTFAKNYAVLK